MTSIHSMSRSIAVCLAMGFGIAGTAQAEVIGFDAGADFSQAPYNVGLGENNQAGYVFDRFLYDPTQGPVAGSSPGVATRGTAQVAASPIVADTVSTFLSGSRISDDMIFGGPFTSFETPAQAQVDNDFAFLGLKFQLDDGVHFGYAELNDFTLARFAYQSEPGAAIQTGQALDAAMPGNQASPVPAPSGVPFFCLGLGLIAWTWSRGRRHS
ncbi:hypothetical protein V5738_10700 [Salinisphaera sp. SPP-AMP-43]|uniref:hypothetical protein n=1 Tax=Salinisphaera sp. SPP-AMP-43 TaxID=3121288 RepID=UPI003C6E30D7